MDLSAVAVIEDDSIVIRLPIKNLPVAVDGSIALRALDSPFKVTDAAKFAHDVVVALNDEDEEGTTRVHQMFDGAFSDIAENGSDGIADNDAEDDNN